MKPGVTLLFVLWQILGGANALASLLLPCARMVKGPPYFEPFVGQKTFPQSEFPGADIFYLGSGNAASAFRVQRSEAESMVYKMYRSPEPVSVGRMYYGMEAPQKPRPPKIPPEVVIRDFDVMVNHLLEAEARQGADLGFKMPGVEKLQLDQVRDGQKIGEYACMKFKIDIRGRSVFSLLEDETLEKEFRGYVLAVYQEKLDRYQRFLEKRFQGKINLQLMEELRKTRAHEAVIRYPLIVMDVVLDAAFDGSRNHTMTVKADGVLVESYTFDYYLVDVD